MTAEALTIPTSGCTEKIGAALSLFSSTLSRFENIGLIVREFPQKRDDNIWVFGHLLDAVETAATAERYERRRFDHVPMLKELASTLEWQGHSQAADIARKRLESAVYPPATSIEEERLYRHGNMRRFLNFALGLMLEIKANGIWPDNADIETYTTAYAACTPPGSTPSFLLDVRDLIDDIAKETTDETAAISVMRFRTWKRRYF